MDKIRELLHNDKEFIGIYLLMTLAAVVVIGTFIFIVVKGMSLLP